MNAPTPAEAGRQKARATLVTRTFLIVVIVVAVIIVTLQLWSTLAIRQTQVNNTQRAQDTLDAATEARKASDRIEDCTTPGRKCYDDATKRQAGVIGIINESNRKSAAAAAWCAMDNHTFDTILRCVNKQLGVKP